MDKETGQPHTSFYMADIKRLLALYVHECPSLHAVIRSQPTTNLEAILAEDEATARQRPQSSTKNEDIAGLLHNQTLGPVV